MYALKKIDQEIEEMLIREFTSLCDTCDHFTTCTFPFAGSDVIQCEMFEDNSSHTLSVSKSTPVILAGLCSNCANNGKCRLPRDPAGVWHCEEYK